MSIKYLKLHSKQIAMEIFKKDANDEMLQCTINEHMNIACTKVARSALQYA